MNAVDGYQDVWEFLADKNAPIDQRRLAVVYLFTRYKHDTTIHDLDRLTERFFKLLINCNKTEIKKLDRFLFGDIIMVRDFDDVTRSIDDNIRIIGFFDFSNPRRCYWRYNKVVYHFICYSVCFAQSDSSALCYLDSRLRYPNLTAT